MPARASGTSPAVPDLSGGLTLDVIAEALAERIAEKTVQKLANRTAAHGTIDDDELLTYQQIADLLTATNPPPMPNVQRPTAEYVAALVRRGELAGVPFGKYRRVRRGDYRAWLARHRTAGLDPAMYHRYMPIRERRRIATHPAAEAPTEPGEARRTARRDRNDRGPLGAERTGDLGARRPLRPRARRGTHEDPTL